MAEYRDGFYELSPWTCSGLTQEQRHEAWQKVVTATDAEADAVFDTLMTEKASLFNTLAKD